jgi:hypothetical protein
MRRTVCPLLACVTLLSTALIGQNKAPVTADSSQASLPSDPIRRLNESHKRAYEALHAEQERAKQPLCYADEVHMRLRVVLAVSLLH